MSTRAIYKAHRKTGTMYYVLRTCVASISILAMLSVPALSYAAASTSIVAQRSNARQQINTISAFIDGSVVYGSDQVRAKALRSLKGGKLATSSGDLMPFNSAGLPNANDAHVLPDNKLFLAGDVRANENPELTAVQTLFVREHNRLAGEIAAQHPKWTDEQIYQAARKVVIAELQVITYKEFLPALLGENPLKSYTGYKPNLHPGIFNEFSTAAFRIGHTLINDDIEFIDNNGDAIRPEVALKDVFFVPTVLTETGPDPILKYLSTDNAQEVDTKLIDDLRNFLFGPPGAGGMDLASLNIERGRDHGLADYNSVRKVYGLKPVTEFSQITSDTTLQQKLKNLYSSVNEIDLWVGGLAEDHVPGSSVGPLFRAIIARQFENLRDGDRFWYQRVFSGEALQKLENTRLKDVLERNTTLSGLQENVFFFEGEESVAAKSTVVQRTLPTSVQSSTTANQKKNMNTRQLISLFAGFFQRLATEQLDGGGNNLMHPIWGKAGIALLRTAPSAYADGVSAPAGANRPSARAISNAISMQDEDALHNSRHMSDWVYAWGQFIDHDIDLTTQGSEGFDIKVPSGDPSFDPLNTGTQVIPFMRSNYDPLKAQWTRDTSRKIENSHRRVFPSL